MRNQDEAILVAKYILENPVRAQLVERPQDYPFLGSRTYSVQEILDAIGAWRGFGSG